MPIFTNPISSQNTATSSGKKTYPQTGEAVQGTILSDDFTRESLNPTGTIVLYTVGIVGTGTADVSNAGELTLITSANINDALSVRTSGLQFKRASFFIDPKSVLTFDCIFRQIGTITSTQGFFGFILSTSSLTSLPTTVRHMGLFYDTSGTGNYVLSSSDGVTQTTTDTGEPITALTRYRLNISYTGINSATISLYKGTNFSTLIKSQTVTALGSIDFTQAYELYFFNKTLAALSKEVRIEEWAVSST